MLGGNAILLLRVVYVDVVDQLRHHAPGDFRCVDVLPDGFQEGVNVHPLALALFQLQPEGLDPLGVLPLLLFIPLGYFRKLGVVDLLAHDGLEKVILVLVSERSQSTTRSRNSTRI